MSVWDANDNCRSERGAQPPAPSPRDTLCLKWDMGRPSFPSEAAAGLGPEHKLKSLEQAGPEQGQRAGRHPLAVGDL